MGKAPSYRAPARYCDSCEEPLGSPDPAEAAPARQTPPRLRQARRRRRDTMALASAKSSALEDNNKAVNTGMKWSVEARAEIPQAMRDEIEAEMATKRVLRGGTEEDRMRARAETASLKKKVMDLRTPKNVKMPEPNDIVPVSYTHLTLPTILLV